MQIRFGYRSEQLRSPFAAAWDDDDDDDDDE